MGDFIVQGINNTTLYAEKIYSKNFSAVDEKFVLVCIITVIIHIYLLMASKN